MQIFKVESKSKMIMKAEYVFDGNLKDLRQMLEVSVVLIEL